MNYDQFARLLYMIGMTESEFAHVSNTPPETVRNWKYRKLRDLPGWVQGMMGVLLKQAEQPNLVFEKFSRIFWTIVQGERLRRSDIRFLAVEIQKYMAIKGDLLVQTKYARALLEAAKVALECSPDSGYTEYCHGNLNALSGGKGDPLAKAFASLREEYVNASWADYVSRCLGSFFNGSATCIPTDRDARNRLCPYYLDLYRLAKRCYMVGAGRFEASQDMEIGKSIYRPHFEDVPLQWNEKFSYSLSNDGQSWAIKLNDMLVSGDFSLLSSLRHALVIFTPPFQAFSNASVGERSFATPDASYGHHSGIGPCDISVKMDNVLVKLPEVWMWLNQSDFCQFESLISEVWKSYNSTQLEWLYNVWGDI